MRTGSPGIADDLALALRLADHADAVTVDRFRAMDLRVETKPDLTPVTDADRSVESDMRRELAATRRSSVKSSGAQRFSVAASG